MTDTQLPKNVKKLVKKYEFLSLREKGNKSHPSIAEIFQPEANTNTENVNGKATINFKVEINKTQTSEIVYSVDETLNENSVVSKKFTIKDNIDNTSEMLDDSDHDSFATDDDENGYDFCNNNDKNEYDNQLAEGLIGLKNIQIRRKNKSKSLKKSNSFSACTQQELNKMPTLSWTFDFKNFDEKLKQILGEFIENYQCYLITLEDIMSYKILFEKEAISTSKFSPQKTTYFFGNIAEIYGATKTFNEELQSQKLNIDDLLEIYSKKQEMLKLYPYYMANKKRSYKYLSHFFKFSKSFLSIVNEHQIDSDLLAPTQRLVKDQNMFKRILDEYKQIIEIINVEKKVNKINEVIALIDTNIKEGTTIIELESINNCPFDIDVTGLFIRKDNFIVRNSFQNINLESTIVLLLFEKILIFAENSLCGEDRHEMYEFKYSILLQNLGYSTLGTETLNFEFTDFKDERRSIVFMARSIKIKDEWTKIINKELLQQLLKHREDTMQREATIGTIK